MSDALFLLAGGRADWTARTPDEVRPIRPMNKIPHGNRVEPVMTHTCTYCAKKFRPRNKGQEACSRRCSLTLRSIRKGTMKK